MRVKLVHGFCLPPLLGTAAACRSSLQSEHLSEVVVKVFREILLQPLKDSQIKDPFADVYLKNLLKSRGRSVNLGCSRVFAVAFTEFQGEPAFKPGRRACLKFPLWCRSCCREPAWSLIVS